MTTPRMSVVDDGGTAKLLLDEWIKLRLAGLRNAATPPQAPATQETAG